MLELLPQWKASGFSQFHKKKQLQLEDCQKKKILGYRAGLGLPQQLMV